MLDRDHESRAVGPPARVGSAGVRSAVRRDLIMFRHFAPFGFALAALACPPPSVAGADPEAALGGKGLYPSGSMYVLRAEDEVKKAVAAAEARVREYRRALAWEKDAGKSESEKKA